MKISRKILLGYGLLSLIVIATGVVGYCASIAIGRDFDYAVNRTQPVVATIDAIRFHAMGVHGRAHDVQIGRDGEKARALLQHHLAELDAAGRRHSELVALYFPGEVALGEQIATAIERFRAEAAQVAEIPENGPAMPAANHRLDGALEEVLALAGQAADKEQAEFGEYQLGVNKTVEQNLAAIILTSVAGFLGALLVGLAIARRIEKPIAALTVTASAFGRGELGARAAVSSRDEIGTLAAAFNRMAETLGDTMVSRDYMEKILESMSEAVVVLDADGKVERSNGAARHLLSDEGGGIHPVAVGALLVAAGGAQGARGTVETTIVDAEGYAVPVELSLSALPHGGREEGLVLVMRDIRERKLAEEQLRRMANYDGLTGLVNRNLLITLLQQTLARLAHRKNHAAVMFCDLDRFKVVNDAVGHNGGDALLKCLGERLQELVRPGDVVARLGGDEFVILLNDIAHQEDVVMVADKILRGAAKPLQVGPYEFTPTLSIGICIAPADGIDAHELLKNADLAMYEAKREGRNRFCFYSGVMGERLARHLRLEAALRKALDDGDGLLVHYQVQQAIDGSVLGFEALVRWNHLQMGLISPAQFLPIAEEAGLMARIDEWVLREACARLAAWRAQGWEVPQVAVNVSDQMFKRVDLIDLVRKVLEENGLPGEALELELTEAILMEDVDRAWETMHALRALRVTLAVDDFGTGYSSLAQLKHCPIQKLKIDRSFVSDITHNEGDAAIVEAIIAMANKLHLCTLAEGVETEAQKQVLIRRGVDALQGYLLGRPIAASEVPVFLQRHAVGASA